MVRRTGLVIVLAISCIIGGGNIAAAGQNRTSNDDVAASTSIAPPFITPGKDLFVVREGDQVVVVVTATCLLEDDSDAQFELQPSSPGFVYISDAYRKENKALGYSEGVGLIYLSPQIGDAGKYVVTLQVKACNGKVERVISFKVRVKRANND